MTDPRPQRVRVTTDPRSAHPEGDVFTIEPTGTIDAHGPIGHVGSSDRHGRLPVEVVVDGWRFELLVENEARAALRERASRDRSSGGAAGGPLEIRAIIPGRIVAVSVAPGDKVEVGQSLLAVEAMKMQNELAAPRAGTVTRVPVEVGATVELGDVLVVVE